MSILLYKLSLTTPTSLRFSLKWTGTALEFWHRYNLESTKLSNMKCKMLEKIKKYRKQETELPLDEGQLYVYVAQCRFLGLLMDPSVANRLSGCFAQFRACLYVCVWDGGGGRLKKLIYFSKGRHSNAN